MSPRLFITALIGAGALGAAMLVAVPVTGQQDSALDDPESTRAAMQRAEAEAKRARQRGAQLEEEAAKATAKAEKTAQEAAALAARIQEAEAGIVAAESRLSLIQAARRKLDRQLAQRREPLVRLTAALQNFARRPLAVSALKPGSLRETVYLRALLDSTVPQVRQRTAALRGSIERGQALAREADQAIVTLREQETVLGGRQRELAALESRQRIVSRQASGAAAREAERALALSEEARDLSGLVRELSSAAELREELAALPGPVLRPFGDNAAVAAQTPDATPSATASASNATAGRGRLAPVDLQLPVAGRTVAGFGSVTPSGIRSEGVTIVPRGGAQVIAPAAGRVAFAGPYRGFGRIVILEHGGGWTSLVTGLARSDVDVGEELVAGAPLGVAGVEDPEVTLELRRGQRAVNPLDYVG
ncbi:peptidoglycan DD-metalloendopeptidase family protein [Erythrobacteraceae bacterium WH01K]|nr:peptidoglycan DD-metalloendopeptidase family protein [Erythrobacteraceae bacterium WH01K]